MTDATKPAGEAPRGPGRAWRDLGLTFADWTTRELVVAAVLSVAVGVIFWAWGQFWAATGMDNLFPYSYTLVGPWMLGGLFVAYVIRRPGAALYGELVAAFVSMAMGNKWGLLTMASGAVQGVGAEIVFALGRWRSFRGIFLYGASALAGAFSILLDIFVYSYYRLYTWSSILVAGVLIVVSSVILGGVLAQSLGEALARTGVLSGFAIAKGKVKRI